ncbi:MAG: SRPBCC domain-containing protein [Myxococcota bacterium]
MSVVLVVRRTIQASPARLFAAWTEPQHLTKWWGPPGVACPEAEVDLRVGGRYRIANRLPDGSTLWIAGEFRQVERPERLVYTWAVGDEEPSLVTVHFRATEGATEVIVTHDRIADEATRDEHEQGWLGCLDGLVSFMAPV